MAHQFVDDVPSPPMRGFLPEEDPLSRLPQPYAVWDELGQELPRLLATNRAMRALEALPVLDPSGLHGRELDRAMLLLSFFGHAAIWENWRRGQGRRVPEGVAVPWVQVAARLNRPPVLTYGSHALYNWRRLDASGPVALGNLVPQMMFYGGLDESWFVAVHVEIEAKAVPAIEAICQAQRAAAEGRTEALLDALRRIAAAQEDIQKSLLRIPENCDPYIFFNRIQPFFHGFKDVVYEGVGEAKTFLGCSAAQSAFLPLLDGALGVQHGNDALSTYLFELRAYMIPQQRGFLEAVERGPSIRACIERGGPRIPELVDAYNTCLDWTAEFRAKHQEFAATYITKQSAKADTGTGGTPFMQYLKKHLDDTRKARLPRA